MSYNKGKKTSPGLIQFMLRKELIPCGEASEDIKTCKAAGLNVIKKPYRNRAKGSLSNECININFKLRALQ